MQKMLVALPVGLVFSLSLFRHTLAIPHPSGGGVDLLEDLDLGIASPLDQIEPASVNSDVSDESRQSKWSKGLALS